MLVRVIKDEQGRQEGMVIEVLERNTSEIVGRYFEENGISFVTPSNKNISQDIIVINDKNMKSGQLVVVGIITYPSFRRQPTGKILEILGDYTASGMEVKVATRAYNLPYKWSEEVLENLDKESVSDTSSIEYEKRQDLRNLPFVTIDGEDAKDFDDAVYCEVCDKGWNLYVAIADVSFYVKPDTLLDKEAFLRGNSVYFPDTVIPMLPEILSNDLCSLKPKTDRLCLVCSMRIGKDGKIKSYKFQRAVIHSHARLTYEKANDILERGDNEFFPHLNSLYSLFKALYGEREKRGAINFEGLDQKIVFDKNHKIKRIVPVVRNDAHRIIEECMLAANVCAAKFLSKQNIPFLYRIHEKPDPVKLKNLRSYLNILGLNLYGKTSPKPQDYAKLLDEIKERSDKHIIEIILLRSMRQAIYSRENVGHFGLAYKYYTHFTSPIRRYPDLLTHRAICHVLDGGDLASFYSGNEIHNFGEHCSMTERRADDAVWHAVDLLKCGYMLDKVGLEFQGVISRVSSFGIFVELENIYIDGLVHISNLPNDYYDFDSVSHRLVGKRSSRIYSLGDRVNVAISRVDMDDRQIDLELVK